MTALTPRAGVTSLPGRAIRFPVATLATVAGAITVAVTAARLGQPRLAVAAFGGSAALLAVAAWIDAAEERIPNRLLLAGLTVIGVAPVILGDAGLLAAAGVGLLLGGLPLLAVLLTREIGVGDVKLAAVLGATAAYVHPLAPLGAVFISAFASSAYAAARRIRRLALGPWLWGGFAVSTALTSLFTEGLH